MKTHTMHLDDKSFDQISQWSKTIELRLFDEKRQKLVVWDSILFINNSNLNETIQKEIVWLLIYKDFASILGDYPVNYFWGYDIETTLASLYHIYTKEDESKYGVVWIRLSSTI